MVGIIIFSPEIRAVLSVSIIGGSASVPVLTALPLAPLFFADLPLFLMLLPASVLACVPLVLLAFTPELDRESDLGLAGVTFFFFFLVWAAK